MKKSELKKFDIASYDIEIEFNKKMSPIEKKINKLDETHAIKSLKAHKDFLTREKNSKVALKELENRLDIRTEKIEQAAANKLIKLNKHENGIKATFNTFKAVQNEAAKKEKDVLSERKIELQIEEDQDIETIVSKYKLNVESYVEKLDTYNNNFQNNKEIYANQYDNYTKILNESLEKIDQTKIEQDKIIEESLATYINNKEQENNVSTASLDEVERELSKSVIDIRKESNVKTHEVKLYVNELKANYKEKYKAFIKVLTDQLEELKESYNKRTILIDKDLSINLSKLDQQLLHLTDKKSKKQAKSLNQKKALFELRATTVLKYEEQVYNQKIAILNHEIAFLQTTLTKELLNLDKLQIFLVNDQNQLKDTGEYFKNLNLELKSELTNSEIANNEYLVKHEKLKTEFTNNYTKQFNEIKRRLIDANKSQIEQLTTINSELDEINKFLDTVEPLKEIELNKLRESIEVNEVKERYNIKYAKQEHETKIINNNTKKVIELENLMVKIALSENNKAITQVKNKEIQDKAIEKAKLKFNKAEEIYKLRLNSTKLERQILKSSYDTELSKENLNKELVSFEIKKSNALLSKTISQQIDGIKIESGYKSEVINKRLEEDLLKITEKISKISYERDSFKSTVDIMVSKEEHKIDLEIIAINNKMDQKLDLIDEAVQREIKDPSLNIARSEVIIKERLAKFKQNDDFYEEFIESSLTILQDETLTPNQLKQVIVKNKAIIEKTTKYITNTYEVLIEAALFMNELESRAILSQISSSTDSATIKRLKKLNSKNKHDLIKYLSSLKSAKKEQISRINTVIKGNFSTLNKMKNVELDLLKEQTENIYSQNFKLLQSLQENVLNDVNKVYLPLTKNDQDLVDNVYKNAVKAKDLIERNREFEISPINKALGEFIKDKEAEKHRVIDKYNRDMKVLEEEVEYLQKQADEKIDLVTKDQQDLIVIQEDQLNLIKSSEEEAIEGKIIEISQNKLALEASYNKSLASLDVKDVEAKKIFEYEERIYKIALETAESRFNDASIKSDKAHNLKVNDKDQGQQVILNNADRNIERINRELVESTNEFEKKIFTVRPRFEESIGDAQKAIDDEKEIKDKRKEELLELNFKMTDSIESGLFTTFREAYGKLQQNLNYYLEKYKVIEDEYYESILNANKVLSDNYTVFSNALFELGKKKITDTQISLREFNEKIE